MECVRVLHVLHSMNCGGAETLLMHLYRNVDRQRIQFDFLVNVFDEMFYEKEIGSLGGRIYRMPFLTKTTPIGYVRDLTRFFKAHPYRIVHSHLETTTGLILGAAKRAGVPVRIAHSHTSRFSHSGLSAVPENLFKAFCRTRVVPNATKLFGCSELANAWLYGKHAGESTLLRNGIDVDACAFDGAVRREMRRALAPDEVQLFGHVGRFTDEKNHAFLLDIFSRYRRTHPNARLLLVGDGPLRQQCEAQAQREGLADSVRFLGLRDDVPRLLQAMDCFLLPSKYEGLPLVIVEAEAAGLPCLAADTVSPMANLGAGPFRFLPLEADAWIDAMENVRPREDRADAAAVVRAHGYDSREQAEALQAYYLQVMEEL
ncbi:MAG: glycosyltransferase family 1 protein [Clostridia bacterium]|nr:glycosyltransferase family 1 protein [Clostridia bacterium]